MGILVKMFRPLYSTAIKLLVPCYIIFFTVCIYILISEYKIIVLRKTHIPKNKKNQSYKNIINAIIPRVFVETNIIIIQF